MLATRTDRGITALLVQSRRHGSNIHSLVAGAVGLPIILGSLVLRGERLGWYGNEFTLALFSVLLIVVAVGLVWSTGNERQKIQSERLKAEASLRDSEERLELWLTIFPTWFG